MKTLFLIAGATPLCGMSAPTRRRPTTRASAFRGAPAGPRNRRSAARAKICRQRSGGCRTLRYGGVGPKVRSCMASTAMQGTRVRGLCRSISAWWVGVPGFPGVAATMRVSAITDVQRRSDGMRVKGLIDSGVVYRGGYGGEPFQGGGEGGEAYAIRHPSKNDLVFRCNLDTAGLVSSMRVERHTTTYRRY